MDKENNTVPCPRCGVEYYIYKIGFCPYCGHEWMCKECYNQLEKNNVGNGDWKHCANCKKAVDHHYCVKDHRCYLNLTPFRFDLLKTVFDRDNGFNSFNAFLTNLVKRLDKDKEKDAWGIVFNYFYSNPFKLIQTYRK